MGGTEAEETSYKRSMAISNQNLTPACILALPFNSVNIILLALTVGPIE